MFCGVANAGNVYSHAERCRLHDGFAEFGDLHGDAQCGGLLYCIANAGGLYRQPGGSRLCRCSADFGNLHDRSECGWVF